MVRVFEYYADEIVKNSYLGLVVSHERHQLSEWKEHIIYEVLALDGPAIGKVERAEEFAIDFIPGDKCK